MDPIGGIQQKMAGARAAGATVFLTPASNCPDTAGAVPAGMRLIKVSTLSGAIRASRRFEQARPARLPSCEPRDAMVAAMAAAGPRSSKGGGRWPSVLQAIPGRPAGRHVPRWPRRLVPAAVDRRRW